MEGLWIPRSKKKKRGGEDNRGEKKPLQLKKMRKAKTRVCAFCSKGGGRMTRIEK